MAPPSRASLVARLVAVEASGDLRIPEDLAADLARHDLGLLVLVLAVANWGVAWEREAPADPALPWIGEAWAGPGRGGKRWGDYSRGGLGIAHYGADARLREVYARWGSPRHVPPSALTHATWEALHSTSARVAGWTAAWDHWAAQLVEREGWPLWQAESWIDHYWAPAAETYLSGDAPWLDRVEAAAINARIGNSRSGWARALRGAKANAAQQAASYVVQKMDEGGEGARSRAKRQLALVMRVRVVVEALGIAELP